MNLDPWQCNLLNTDDSLTVMVAAGALGEQGICNHQFHIICKYNPDSKVRGANMGPTWVLSAPGWPHVGPMNLTIKDRLPNWYLGLHTYIKLRSAKINHNEPVVVFNSSTPSATYMRQLIGSALVQIMACCLFDTKPLSKPMLGYYQLEPYEQTPVKFNQNMKLFLQYVPVLILLSFPFAKCVVEVRFLDDKSKLITLMINAFDPWDYFII